eukprot:TRINITY_DN12731_c1_g2_i1.p1 TRINITY_DN12731_c1_g2~~TRINITY_DN12731_c1_g2_i1.p1  ORF type:complete len:563 (+),score=115.79 TRINITY_DN12731_c1_g2_i1:152-1840(+)
MKKGAVTCVGLLLSAVAVAAAGPRVTTSGGVVEGNALPGANEFLGMKFADAARYERPVDFTGKYSQQPLMATDFQLACMQVGDSANETYGSEDCLFMNVWQPSDAKPGSNLPVIVFIYGGSNMFGEAEAYNGSAMPVRHNVVYASLAYRTGPLGWMAFEEDFTSGKTTGNYGQLDQQSALRWVQREIYNFGGDPGRVIIHGQSSGASCTSLHLVMPESKNLIRGLVSESGGLGAKSNISGSISNTNKIAENLNCVGSVKKCLQEAPALNLTQYTYKFGWGPVVDKVTIPDDPMRLVDEGKINEISVIMGAQTNDSMRGMMKVKEFVNPDGTLKPLSPILYRVTAGEAAPLKFHERLFSLYPPTETASAQNVQMLGSITSDKSLCSTRRTCNAINKKLSLRVFMYRFNYFYQSNQQCTAEPNYHSPHFGSVHEDEVTFVMGQPIFMFDGSCCGKWGNKLQREPCDQLPRCTNCFNTTLGEGYHAYFNEKEWEFSQLVGGSWAQLARQGNPTTDKATWPVFSSSQNLTKNIVLDANLPGGSVVEDSLYNNAAICQFWDDVAADN